jgi:anti-anti-sigma factor
MTSETLDVRELDLGAMTVLGLDGRLDAATSARFQAAVRRALDRDSTTIVLDCSLLKSMGRSEVAVLVDAKERVREHHGRFVMRQPNDDTRAVLADAGVLDDIEIEN